MRLMLSLLLFTLTMSGLTMSGLTISGAEAGGRDTCPCTRKRICNGVMCDSVCEAGSVMVDPWVDGALAFQRRLQWDEPLVRATLIGSHNSAITQAYGFGIEQDFISRLLNRTEYVGDDEGEGVCQSLSVEDQLRMGLRHIEVDITSGYFLALEPGAPHIDEMFVCHSPFPLDPRLVAEVELEARRRGISLGWAAKNLSCLGTRLRFEDMLLRIKGWMDLPGNEEEVVVVFLDTKPFTASLPSQVSSAYATIRSVFGAEGMFKPKDGNPLETKMVEFVRMGKRVIFEDHENEWNHPENGEDVIVFTPDLFAQFHVGDFVSYPNCTVKGRGGWQGSVWQRGLSTPYSFAYLGTRCGVNIVSPDYVQPRDMASYVWSWAPGEAFKVGECVVMGDGGRWYAAPCGLDYSLACRSVADEKRWELARPGGVCAEGFVAKAPTNGFVNAHLAAAVDVWPVYINVTLLKGGASESERKHSTSPTSPAPANVKPTKKTGGVKLDRKKFIFLLMGVSGAAVLLGTVVCFRGKWATARRKTNRYRRVSTSIETPEPSDGGTPLSSPDLWGED